MKHCALVSECCKQNTVFSVTSHPNRSYIYYCITTDKLEIYSCENLGSVTTCIHNLAAALPLLKTDNICAVTSRLAACAHAVAAEFQIYNLGFFKKLQLQIFWQYVENDWDQHACKLEQVQQCKITTAKLAISICNTLKKYNQVFSNFMKRLLQDYSSLAFFQATQTGLRAICQSLETLPGRREALLSQSPDSVPHQHHHSSGDPSFPLSSCTHLVLTLSESPALSVLQMALPFLFTSPPSYRGENR